MVLCRDDVLQFESFSCDVQTRYEIHSNFFVARVTEGSEQILRDPYRNEIKSYFSKVVSK
jgi:hypothetical protein